MRIQYYSTMLCLCLLATTGITAQTQWVGPANGNWFDDNNWLPVGIPGPGNNALIGGGATVVIGSALNANFSITNFGGITLNAAFTNGGTFDNSGTLTVSATGSLTNNANFVNNNIISFSGTAAFTNGVAATFTNGGSFTLQTTLLNQGTVTNNGTIDATNGTLQTQGTFNNNQTLTTKSLSIGAGSSFTNDFGSTLNITGAGATLKINGTMTKNGTVNNAGAATLAGTLNNNVSFNIQTGGTLTVNLAAQLSNTGTVTNAGTFTNNGTVTNTNQFVNAGTADNFSIFNNNATLTNQASSTFTNRTGATISQGFGAAIQNAGTFTNQAAINSFGALNNDGTFSNTGSITMFSGGAFDNNGGFTNNATLTFNEQARNDGTMTNTSVMNLNAGAMFSNFSTFLNSTTGTLINDFEIRNKSGATFTNNGVLQNNVRIFAEGGNFINNANLRSVGNITVQAGGTLNNNELLFLNAGNLRNEGSVFNTKKLLVDDCSSLNNVATINNTGGNLELHGIFFQTGSSVSGNPVNVQGGYIHTNATTNAPVVCQNGTFGADINGNVKVYASQLVAFSTFDSCANIVYLANGLARPVFTCADIGTVQNVNLSVRTSLNDELTCVAQVTPVDQLAPVFSNCPRDIIVFTPNPTVPVTWTAPTATDNCTTVNQTSSHIPGGNFPVGITGVTYTATDTYSNSNNCQFRVDVRKTPPGGSCSGDTTPPVITGCPSNITTTAIGQFAVVTWTPPNVSDNCYPITLTSTGQPGQAFFPGTTSVTYTAKDGNNNTSTCTFSVTVGVTNFCLGDTQKPSFVNCPANFYAPTNTVISGAVIIWNTPGAFDLCGVTSVTASHVIGSVFPTGTTNVIYTAVDAAGNSATCNFVITVGADPCPGDLTAPTFSSCPGNVNVTTSGATGTASWTAPTASDPCGPVTVNASHLPGSLFPVGTTQVTYKASDKKGNLASCTFNVNINNVCANDNVNPVITGCPANINVAATSVSGAPASWTPPTATDNCGLAYFAAPYLPGAVFPVGTTTVIYSAFDARGGAATCQFTVTVVTTTGCTTNAAPINNTTGVNPASVALSWNTAPTATSYDVFLGTTNPPTLIVAANVPTTSTTVNNLAAGTTYWWYVVPKNAAGSATGCQSTATNFSTAATIPACTTNSAPANNATGVSAPSTTLTWNAAAGATTYNVLLGTVNPPTTVVASNVAGTSTTVSGLLNNTAYWWYVVPKNAAGSATGCSSSATKFTTVAATGCNKTVLFVVGSATLSASDAALKTRLEQLGFGVTVKDDDLAVTADANAKGLVLISSSALSATVNTKFTNVTVPVMTSEEQLFDDLKMTGTTSGTHFGAQTGVTQMTIQTASHPIAAGLTGTITVHSSAQTVDWGNPGTAAVKVGIVPGNTSKSMIFAYETGATMVGMNAPARRIGYWVYTSSANTLTNDGWKIFDAAIFWATMCPPCPIAPVANCQNITRQQTAAGQPVQISGADVNNGSTAGCAGTITSLNVSPTSFSNPGTYTVTLTVTNSLGLSSTCTATVTILAAQGFDPNKCYKIIAKHSGKALSVQGASQDNGVPIVQNTYTGAANQIWKFEDGGSGFYKLKAQHSGKYLNLVGNPVHADGAVTEQNTFVNIDDFFWKSESDGAGYFRFKLKNNLTKVLDVSGALTDEGTNVIAWTQQTGDNQRWQIVEVPCLPVCNNMTSGGTIAKSCSGGQVSLTSSVLPSGGSGTIEYMWISGTTNCNPDNMTPVPGANAAVLTVANPAVTTYYIRCSRRNPCTAWDGESNCITVTANECGNQGCSGNLLFNGGFENDYTGWAWVDAPATTTMSGVYAGTKSAQVCTDDGGAGNQTTIVPGATLTLKAYAKISGTPDWAGLGINFYDANWVQIGTSIQTTVTATAWTQYTVTAVAPQNAKYVDCWFFKNRNGCLYTDDFCLTQNISTVCNSTVLFVVGNTTLNTGDNWVKNRLTLLGMTVTTKSDVAVTTADASGKGLVIISSTTNSSNVNTKFTNVAVPVITWESYLLDDLKMTGTGAESDYGVGSHTSLSINDATHPLAAGLSGTVQVYSSTQSMAWGNTSSASAAKVAKISGQNSKLAIFAYAQGATMPGGINAPHRRVSLFLYDVTGPLLNTNGIKLFDAAIEWATNCNVLNISGNEATTEEREKGTNDLNLTVISSGVRVYPNPVQNELFVQVPGFEGRESLIRVFDASGRLVRELETTLAEEPLHLNVSDLRSGQYLIWMLPEGERQPVSKKFMVERRP